MWMRTGATPRDTPKPDAACVTEPFGKELVIYSLRSNQVHCLNVAASLVWTLCDGSRSLSAVVDEFARVVGAAPSAVQGDVRDAVAQFRSLGVLR